MSHSNHHSNRHPAGTPHGGQFAPGRKTETTQSLAATPGPGAYRSAFAHEIAAADTPQKIHDVIGKLTRARHATVAELQRDLPMWKVTSDPYGFSASTRASYTPTGKRRTQEVELEVGPGHVRLHDNGTTYYRNGLHGRWLDGVVPAEPDPNLTAVVDPAITMVANSPAFRDATTLLQTQSRLLSALDAHNDPQRFGSVTDRVADAADYFDTRYAFGGQA